MARVGAFNVFLDNLNEVRSTMLAADLPKPSAGRKTTTARAAASKPTTSKSATRRSRARKTAA
jgi:hypothetical protein